MLPQPLELSKTMLRRQCTPADADLRAKMSDERDFSVTRGKRVSDLKSPCQSGH